MSIESYLIIIWLTKKHYEINVLIFKFYLFITNTIIIWSYFHWNLCVCNNLFMCTFTYWIALLTKPMLETNFLNLHARVWLPNINGQLWKYVGDSGLNCPWYREWYESFKFNRMHPPGSHMILRINKVTTNPYEYVDSNTTMFSSFWSSLWRTYLAHTVVSY